MIFERTLMYSSYALYSIYVRMVVGCVQCCSGLGSGLKARISGALLYAGYVAAALPIGVCKAVNMRLLRSGLQ